MSDLNKRQIAPLKLPDVVPDTAGVADPEFVWVDPGSLLVDEGYQRNLSERSVKLIRKIVAQWDWRRFKPPVVARTADGLEVVDGQHTAIAAVSHPMVAQIPVMVIDAAEQTDRAKAFVGHNRDRIALTPGQMHAAAVLAGDEDAVTIEQVCARAGVRVLKSPPGNGIFKPRDTMAISSIKALINRRGAMKARMVLDVLAKADCTPISASGIKAVEALMHESEYEGTEPDDITTALIALADTADQEAKVFAAAHGVPMWRGLVVILFKRARRGRRRAA